MPAPVKIYTTPVFTIRAPLSEDLKAYKTLPSSKMPQHELAENSEEVCVLSGYLASQFEEVHGPKGLLELYLYTWTMR